MELSSISQGCRRAIHDTVLVVGVVDGLRWHGLLRLEHAASQLTGRLSVYPLESFTGLLLSQTSFELT